MSDEDRKAFWEWWKNGSNDDPEDAWLAALAWERGRQKVLWEGYLKISSDGLGAVEFSSPTSHHNAVRVKIVEAE